MSNSLIIHERIKTTETKAKALSLFMNKIMVYANRSFKHQD